MRCRCGRPARAKLRGTPLCKAHFIERYEKAVKGTIKKFHLLEEADRVLVAISGGKDSAALAGALKSLGYDIEGLFIDLGIREYSNPSLKAAEDLADMLGFPLHVVRPEDYIGLGLGKYGRSICSVCGSIKRYIMNKFAIENGFSKVATGHNLDDMAEAFIRNISSGWPRHPSPYLPANLMAAPKVKPLAEMSEKENALYAMLRGLPFYDGECPFADLRKRLRIRSLLWEIEKEVPGFMRGMIQQESHSPVMRRCRICGYPSSGEVCTICRLKGKR